MSEEEERRRREEEERRKREAEERRRREQVRREEEERKRRESEGWCDCGCRGRCGKKYLFFPIPNYSGGSIADALKSIGAQSSYNYRCTIAAKNGIGGYCGTPAQNIHMLQLLKGGNLLRP